MPLSHFLSEVGRFTAEIAKTIQEKSPLKTDLLNKITCLDTNQLITENSSSETTCKLRGFLLDHNRRNIFKPEFCDF